MKTLLFIAVTAVVALYFSPLKTSAGSKNNGVLSVPPPPESLSRQSGRDRGRPGRSFVVLELFTSEGCSSCPPADALIEKIQQQHAGEPVYILAFHVDYWNHLGWKDVFSDADYTDRQRRYANWLNVESVYTPQLVVNGTSEYVGSDEGAITKAIDAELKPAASSDIHLKATVANDQLTINYQVAADQKNELVLALVQKAAHSQVKAGENAGKQLSHIQIVRQLLYVNTTAQKTVTMKLPAGFNTTEWELIGLVQNKRNGQIVAAGRAAFQQ